MTDLTQSEFYFDGKTYEPEKDQKRLGKQLLAVRDAMLAGCWRTLNGLSIETGYPEASVSARLRDLRKPRFGGHKVERRRQGDGGTFEYRIVQELD